MLFTVQLRYCAGRRVHPQAARAHVVVSPLQRARQLLLHVLFDGRPQMFRVLRQLYSGVNHDRRTRCGLGHVNVVDLDADKRVRKRCHRKR